MIGVIPLGTGNDMARILRWGKGYGGEDMGPYVFKLARYSVPVKLDRCVDWITFIIISMISRRWRIVCTPRGDPVPLTPIAASPALTDSANKSDEQSEGENDNESSEEIVIHAQGDGSSAPGGAICLPAPPRPSSSAPHEKPPPARPKVPAPHAPPSTKSADDVALPLPSADVPAHKDAKDLVINNYFSIGSTPPLLVPVS